LLSDVTAAERMGHAARALAESHYSWHAIGSGLRDVVRGAGAAAP
jgi:hypothetical protein